MLYENAVKVVLMEFIARGVRIRREVMLISDLQETDYYF